MTRIRPNIRIVGTNHYNLTVLGLKARRNSLVFYWREVAAYLLNPKLITTTVAGLDEPLQAREGRGA